MSKNQTPKKPPPVNVPSTPRVITEKSDTSKLETHIVRIRKEKQ